MSSAPAAVIFDFDGIILDSETPEYEVHRILLARCGLVLTVDEWVHQIGVYSEGYERRWYDRLPDRCRDTLSFDAFKADKHRLFREIAPLTPMPGIAALLARLRHEGIPLAIASSSPARWVVPATNRLGLAGFFRAIVTGDVVARRKPAPDVYLEAAARLGVDPRRAVAVEDSAPGIAAAQAAGMKTIVVPHWLTERHDLSAADAAVGDAGAITSTLLARLVGAVGPDKGLAGRDRPQSL